ncbi:MAG: A/G-specific adenine glycosylase [Clostridiales bacterium GWB2_37_7]|nr:MAG: A/G-specific adenine glycosylase [Clostridiales bacterium GWB2_37_7]
MDSQFITQFQNKLLEWYDSCARILPWRDNPTPYRVWISEIMLQQTRVDTVKPYFESFMKTVPTIQDLADISEDQLLKLWEGLGYYSRAKNLKKAANAIMQSFNGQIPSDLESLRSLPGIGPYSSGAIASIAFGARVAAIDGNVLRVMARIFANKGDIANRLVKKEIEDLVYELLPTSRVGDFNQALMELGATICLPNGNPKCAECLVNTLCKGYQKGFAAELPIKSKKKERKIEQRTIFIIEYKGTVAIRQRANKGLLSSLWEFPNEVGYLSCEESERKLKEWGITPSHISLSKTSKHIFTHLEWHMIGYYISAQSIQEDSQFIWVNREQVKEQYSIPTAFKAYVEFLNESGKK